MRPVCPASPANRYRRGRAIGGYTGGTAVGLTASERCAPLPVERPCPTAYSASKPWCGTTRCGYEARYKLSAVHVRARRDRPSADGQPPYSWTCPSSWGARRLTGRPPPPPLCLEPATTAERCAQGWRPPSVKPCPAVHRARAPPRGLASSCGPPVPVGGYGGCQAVLALTAQR